MLALVAAYTARRATGSRLRGGRAAESRRADPPPYLPGLSQCQCPPHQVLTPIIYPPLPILPRPPHQISNLGFLHLSKQQKSNISANSSFFSPLPILCLFLTSTGRYICTDVLFQHFHQKFVQDSETNVWKRERQQGHFVMSISGTSMISTNWLKIKVHVTPPAPP